MNDHLHGHAAPLITTTAGLVAFIGDEAGRPLALLVGIGGLGISVIRLLWDWEDRRTARAAKLRFRPHPRGPHIPH